MQTYLQLQTFHWQHLQVQLYVPDPDKIKEAYGQQKKKDPGTPFPYWAKVWPAALALGNFLQAHPCYIQNKQVLELAAGLGLPSLVAARFAKHVLGTDYLRDAVHAMQQSVRYNNVQNMRCQLLNWNHIHEDVKADVLLLSDINYEPAAFEQLYNILNRFLHRGTTIILSTPQRLMAKVFIEKIAPWVVQQTEVTVPYEHAQHPISILIMQLPMHTQETISTSI